MRIDDIGENADGENGLFVGEILLGGTLNSKWVITVLVTVAHL